MIPLLTTRFNNETWNENEEYRSKKFKESFSHMCLYPVPQKMAYWVCPNNICFIVEMNNSSNKIEGIGIIRNKIETDYYYHVYKECTFNRYVYKGKYRLSREQLINYNSDIVHILDNILFKGKTHLKRGIGFTAITDKLQRNPVCSEHNLSEEIKQIFLQHYKPAIFAEKKAPPEEQQDRKET